MTTSEKRIKMEEFCVKHKCETCVLKGLSSCNFMSSETMSDEEVEDIYEALANCQLETEFSSVDIMNVMLDEGAYLPTRAHETDAGIDLYAREEITIQAGKSAIFDTGVHIELPRYTVGFLKSKSGLNVKHGITSEGVIDEGYTGSIVAKLYNHSTEDYTVKKGDKITQLVILPILTPKIQLASSFRQTDRGSNGFGSSGK